MSNAITLFDPPQSTATAPCEWKLSMPPVPGKLPEEWFGPPRPAPNRGLRAAACAAALIAVFACSVGSGIAAVAGLALSCVFLVASTPRRRAWEAPAAKLVRRLVDELSRTHAEVEIHVGRLNAEGLADIRRVMRDGGYCATSLFEYPAPGEWDLDGVQRRRAVEAIRCPQWRSYAQQRKELRWQCEQLLWLRVHASSSHRPAIHDLRRWLALHQDRDAGLTGFVRDLLSLADSSDDRVIEKACVQYEVDEAVRSRIRFDQMLEYVRRNRPTPVSPVLPDWAGEQEAARQQTEDTLRRARAQLAALERAHADFESRGEYTHATHIWERQNHLRKAIADCEARRL